MNKELKKTTIDVEGNTYERLYVKTHKIHIKEDLKPVFEKYVTPYIKKGDWIAVSEKFISIAQGRVVHESAVKPGFLAKLIVKGVTKYPQDIGYSHPKKMQVAINQAGTFRMLCAMIGGTITRLFGRRGDFYRIAGHRISEIDGFNPDAMPPFDEFAMLPPEDPQKTCEEMEEEFGIPTVMIDANNINTEILGMSRGVAIKKDLARLILLDNPMGQDDELTPIIIIHNT